MGKTTALSLISAFFNWISSLPDRVTTFLAKQRDAQLKNYTCDLGWVDGDTQLLLSLSVKAQSDDEARRLANEYAVQRLPLAVPLGSSVKFVPPYMKDAAGTVSLWRLKQIPLTDLERDLVAEGKFGPAAASGGALSAAKVH